MEKQITAVEFLENKIFGDEKFSLKEVFEKAKEMEKQQIIDAWTDAEYCNTIGNEINYEDGGQYYKETFK
jgi:hypothetical protein